MNASAEKTGYFGSIKKGLFKTSQLIKSGFVGLFSPDKKKNFEEELENFERILIEADLGAEFSLHLIDEIRMHAAYKSAEELKVFVEKILLTEFMDCDRSLKSGSKPRVLLFSGINGAGKTTSIAKIANMLQRDGKKTMLAAADTFRAAAVDQLSIWAERIGIPIVRHKMGADPGAVAHDACESAKARDIDYVLIDTAGRIHNQNALMEELKKVVRVVKSRVGESSVENLLVLDGNTGQNGFLQAKSFKEAIGIDGIIVTKLDGTAKGGIVALVEKGLSIPVKFIGVGEGMDALVPFSPQAFVKALLEP